MIAFACSISEPEPYIRYCEPGIRLAAEPHSVILPLAAVGTVGRSYNLLLDAAARHEDLEALVILHPHAEIADPALCAKVRTALSDPEVAVVGCAGASDVRSAAWWEGAVSTGDVVHRYTDHGGGEFPAFSWTSRGAAPAEVDAVDGFLLVLSAWCVRSVRFDEALPLGHGYDVDYCLRVCREGRKVVTADLRVIEHRSLEVVREVELWTESHIALARKWQAMTGEQASEATWRARARRAEAEREAARAIAYFRRLRLEARLAEAERDLSEITGTGAWRVTAPLRRLNQWRHAAAERRAAGHGYSSPSARRTAPRDTAD